MTLFFIRMYFLCSFLFICLFSASRMNKTIVVFLKREALVNELTVNEIWLKETFAF